MPTISPLYVIDDDAAVRESLGQLLSASGHKPTLYSDADAFLKEVDTKTAACALLDIEMPGTNGLDLLDTLADSNSAVVVIIVSGHGSVPRAVRAIKSGAFDFLQKPFGANEVLEAVNRASEHLLETKKELMSVENAQSRVKRLTKRENQVMQLLAEGLPNKDIARRLDISPRTVEVHRSHIIAKLEVPNLAGVVKMGILAGAISAD